MRRRLTYANITATLALVFAMSGGALAANHYLITSTKQISPKVIKALKGKAGPQGLQGPQGKEGLTGKEGLAGKEGKEGKEGKQGKEGQEGKEGEEGPRGPSDVWATGDGSSAISKPPLSLSVPAGTFVVHAQTVIAGGSGDSVCSVSGGSSNDNAYGATETAGIGQMTLDNVETTVLTSPGTIKLECTGAAESFFYSELIATQVGTLH